LPLAAEKSTAHKLGYDDPEALRVRDGEAMNTMVIVDYGMGNLRSVQKALECLGYPAQITSDPEVVRRAGKVILPGVGAFADAMARLRESGLDEALRHFVATGRPLLGICLGLQLLFSRSHEDGLHEGLNLLAGEVVRFASDPRLKVPHMGWNTLRLQQPACPLFRGLPSEPAVYFVHSYYAVPEDPAIVAATADYPAPFAAVVWKDNLVATQFHPEKSQRVGLQMLANFARWKGEG
jgi:glutamine amidotransferase